MTFLLYSPTAEGFCGQVSTRVSLYFWVGYHLMFKKIDGRHLVPWQHVKNSKWPPPNYSAITPVLQQVKHWCLGLGPGFQGQGIHFCHGLWDIIAYLCHIVIFQHPSPVRVRVHSDSRPCPPNTVLPAVAPETKYNKKQCQACSTSTTTGPPMN